MKIAWRRLIFCTFWFGAACVILVLELTNQLTGEFVVPRILSWLYDLLGIVGASLVQMILAILGIAASFSRRRA